MAFRFRLARVLEWYDRLYQIEATRLQKCADQAASAHMALARHQESRLATRQQTLKLESLQGNDLRALEVHRQFAIRHEAQLLRHCQSAEKILGTQRSVTLSAQRRVRLVEKLRDRKHADFEYLASRELEETAADSWLAGFARNLIQPPECDR